ADLGELDICQESLDVVSFGGILAEGYRRVGVKDITSCGRVEPGEVLDVSAVIDSEWVVVRDVRSTGKRVEISEQRVLEVHLNRPMDRLCRDGWGAHNVAASRSEVRISQVECRA